MKKIELNANAHIKIETDSGEGNMCISLDNGIADLGAYTRPATAKRGIVSPG